MAERIVSPGVFTRENDLSFLAQGIGEIGAAFIGPFKQGPAFVPTIVRTQSEFADKFGTPDGTYYTEYAVQNYLREAGVATIVRVMNVGGYTQVDPIGLVASGSNGKKLIATIHSTEGGDEAVGFGTFSVDPIESASFAVSGSGIGIVSASLLPSSTSDVRDVFGTSPFGSKDGYVYSYFENEATNFTYDGESGVEAVALADQDFAYDPSVATTPYVKSQLISGERYDLFRFHTLGHGNNENRRFKIGISNVKAAGEDGSTDYSTFSVTVRAFADTDKRKSVLETFNNVNLDPASPNFIGRVIGDRFLTIDPAGKITENGDWLNNSKYIRVEVAVQGTYPVSAAPFAHGAYHNPIFVGGGNESLVPAVVYTTGSVVNTAGAPTNFSGFNFETAGVKIDNLNYLNPIPNSATVGANVDFGFDSQLSYIMSGSDSSDMVKRQFVLAFQSGFDGQSPAVSKNLGTSISAGNSQGFNLSSATANGTGAYQKAINAISNADEYDINMVVTPGVIRNLHPSVTTAVIDMVEARQDCFYIADFTEANAPITQATSQATSVDTNYAATYYPWVKTVDTNTNKLISVPPSVLMPAVFASNDAIGAEWFAPAGLNRGGIVGAVSVLNRLTHSERDTLYENKVNPIASFPGQGIVAFGQKTLQDRASALDRINVRRLLITVKKFVASTSRFLVFEQNTAQTRGRFINTVQPYLEGIQQRQGLFAFKVVMDETNNTPDVVDRNILAGQIFLQPAKTAEFIVIDFNILPTGASFSA
jgi:phage tail sheath protein FI